MSEEISQAQTSQVLSIWKAEGKIAAVKLYMELTGSGLADAKHAVESLSQDLDSETSSNDELVERVLDALEKGNKLQAVKLYKDAHGVSLQQSKEFIENLMGELGDEHQSKGCASVILIGITLAGTLWAAFS